MFPFMMVIFISIQSSNMTMSASFPGTRLPFRSCIPAIRAGVDEAMRTASGKGIPARVIAVCTSRSVVATLPAKAVSYSVFDNYFLAIRQAS